jgi:hypothetical protein
MRVFLAACLAIVILAVGGYFSVNAMQRLSGAAYTTEGARIKASWSWRQMLPRAKVPAGQAGMAIPAAHGDMAAECEIETTWRWILVDFTAGAQEVPDCH